MDKGVQRSIGSLPLVIAAIEERVSILEQQVQQLACQRVKVRKVRVYTDEQKAVIRARLLAGQEAARKEREAEFKEAKKVKTDRQEKDELIN